MLGKIFGGKKAPPTKTPQEAIEELREVEDRLYKKQEYIEKKIQENIAIAKANAATNKRVALKALKQKKALEKQQEHTDGVLQTIDYQRTALENATTNAEIYKLLAGANDAMKLAQKNMDIDKVQDMIDDIAEQQELAKEMADLLANGFNKDYDEDELMAELEALEGETINEKLISVGPTPIENLGTRLPEAPKSNLPEIRLQKQKKEDDDDMAELEQWAVS